MLRILVITGTLALLTAGACASLTGVSAAGPVKSVGVATFVDSNTLIIADWRAGELHSLQLDPVPSPAAKPFNLKNVSAPISRALRTEPDKLRFEDMAFRPGAELAYFTVSIDRGDAVPEPALVTVDAAGKAEVVDLQKARRTSVEIKNRPTEERRIWDTPELVYTVTDMVAHEGKLYVAGLQNASFASTLRVYDLPLAGPATTTTSVEMYHPVHNQLETRAPIRKMAIVTLNGEPSIVGAYTCTPLVTIPIKALKDGAHVTGKTISELGWGSAPVDMVTFDAGQGPMVLLTNSRRSADLMSVASIAEASAQPGVSTPIEWPAKPLLGLKATYIPMSGIAQLANQNKDYFAALRPVDFSGAMELVSIRKGAFLRLSDFVNEYDFVDFKYGPKDPFRGLHYVLRTDEGYPEQASRAK